MHSFNNSSAYQYCVSDKKKDMYKYKSPKHNEKNIYTLPAPVVAGRARKSQLAVVPPCLLSGDKELESGPAQCLLHKMGCRQLSICLLDGCVKATSKKAAC